MLAEAGKSKGGNVETASPEKWTMESIMALKREEAIELWNECSAVDAAGLEGDYTGWIPNTANEGAGKRISEVMFNENRPHGGWLGKTHRPSIATRRDGYNRCCSPVNTAVRCLRFH